MFHYITFIRNYIRTKIALFSFLHKTLFLYQFKRHILKDRSLYPEFRIVEETMKELLRDKRLIDLNDLGAGSKVLTKKRIVSEFVKASAIKRRYGQILFRIARYYRPDCIIELGTGLGISTMYLSMGNPDAKVLTIEGNASIAAIARENFTKNGQGHITVITGKFEDHINNVISEITGNTLIFIDGNHTYEATLRYLNLLCRRPDSSDIMIIDDINWSKGMMQAWREISAKRDSFLTLNLFRMGIVFYGRSYAQKVMELYKTVN
jgi:predicted O-methyltransferase YrrM